MLTLASPSLSSGYKSSVPQCVPTIPVQIDVALLTGGFDKPYVYGIAMALIQQGIRVEVIGSDDVDSPEMHTTSGLSFLNLRGSKLEANLTAKMLRVSIYYLRLIRYVVIAEPKIFHVLWNNKFQFVDRVVLMLYYKALGKKIVFTAHNVNAGKRDANDSLMNRLTLRAQYRLCDHIFVHTDKMKTEMKQDFGIGKDRISVVPFGINNSVPDTDLSVAEAKSELGIDSGEKTILFFGAIAPYKGLEDLTDAFLRLAATDLRYRLIIAGKPKEGCEQYIRDIQQTIHKNPNGAGIIQKVEYIPDEDAEIYFKAADVLVLPYKHVFQSGVLFLAYHFGLPVIASDVGSIGDDIIDGTTGYVCKPSDVNDLMKTLERYFGSDLFNTLESRRQQIRDYAEARHSWGIVGTITRDVYAELLGAE